MNEIITKKKHKNPEWVERIIDAYWFLWRKQYRIREILRGFFITRCHIIDTHLPIQSWYDSDTRMLHGMMSLLVDFVDKDSDIVNWESDEEYKRAMEEIVENKVAEYIIAGNTGGTIKIL